MIYKCNTVHLHTVLSLTAVNKAGMQSAHNKTIQSNMHEHDSEGATVKMRRHTALCTEAFSRCAR